MMCKDVCGGTPPFRVACGFPPGTALACVGSYSTFDVITGMSILVDRDLACSQYT